MAKLLKDLQRLLSAPRVAVVEMNGTVTKGTSPRNINLSRFKPALDRAFKTRNLKAVALSINSPGGSAVQSSLISKYIKQLQKKHNNVPVLAFTEDMCLSGGYYIASAADEIIADESSLVGSVGVLFAGIGFDKFFDYHGLDRRVITSGEFKLVMDPFAPEKDSDVQKMSHVLDGIYGTFVDVVKKSRGDKLNYEVANRKAKAAKPDLPDDPVNGLFDGSFYDGKAALEVGFVDQIDDMHSNLKARFGEDVIITTCKPRGQFPFASSLGASFGAGIATNLLEELKAEGVMTRYTSS